ncbi:MAG TPA: sulfotransferase [Anaerolineales bacterium]|nr:sulfotransferase [Anaerolineales bacterium]
MPSQRQSLNSNPLNQEVHTKQDIIIFMKIFCLGLSRTGTKSLIDALRTLGYHAGHFTEGMNALEVVNGKLVLRDDEVDKWEALGDVPVVPFYQELDRKYPEAKFILTIREFQNWLKSNKKHHTTDHSKYHKQHQIDTQKAFLLRKTVYGSIEFDPDKWTNTYHQHHANVQSHFSNRDQKLLVLNIPQGDGWEKLCPFLDQPIPEFPFPSIRNWSDKK